MNLARKLRDPSLLLLLFSNITAIICAVVFNWGIMNVLWLYWFQSLIIGFFTALKIFTAKITDKDNISFGFFRLADNAGIFAYKRFAPLKKLFLGTYFCLHYGGFHLGLAAFFLSPLFGSAAPIHPSDFFGTLLIVGLFFVTHLFSYCYNYLHKNERELSFARLQKRFSEPYIRVIPMHLTVIAGGWLIPFLGAGGAWEVVLLVFFLSLKTIADLAMHVRKHVKIKMLSRSSFHFSV